MSRKRKKQSLVFLGSQNHFRELYRTFLDGELKEDADVWRMPFESLGHRRKAKFGGWLKSKGLTYCRRDHSWLLEATSEQWFTFYQLNNFQFA